MSSSVPADMINLRLILVSGKTKEFLFSPNDSAADIAKHVYDNWPMDWEEEQVSSPNILRLIYQGRFLHGNVTLGALKLPFGKTTVMHLVARETLPEPNSQGKLCTRDISYSSIWQSSQIFYRILGYFIAEKSQAFVVFCEASNGMLLYMLFIEN
uniref:Ubiquitin-like protein 3 n=1 Tax=Amazona collaria TaxID=241587 RepID=A0A8B9EWM5_9PSIT